MKYIFLYLFLLVLIFLETTIGSSPLVLVLVFVLGLESSSNSRFLGVFLCGMFIDLLLNSVFPTVTILFLFILLFTYLYRYYLPKNILFTFLFLLLFEYLYLYLNGVFPSLWLLVSGLILFLPSQLLMRYYLKFEKQKYLEFDFLTK